MDRHIPASLREQKPIKRCPVEVQMWRENVLTPSEVYSESDCTVHIHKHSHTNTLARPSQGPARLCPSGSARTPVSALSKEAPSVAATGTRSFLQPGSCPAPAGAGRDSRGEPGMLRWEPGVIWNSLTCADTASELQVPHLRGLRCIYAD